MGGIGPTGSVGGPGQQYALKWNDFHASILNSFRHLKDEEDFIDVTIACDGNSFTAHKVVLSACSPYFRSLLKANPCQHPIIILQDVREKDIEALLKFMYNGEVHIGQEQLSDFLKTAQTLQVRGLADVSTKDQHKLSNMSASIPWSTNADDSHSLHPVKRSHSVEDTPPSKRTHSIEHPNSRYSESPQPMDRDSGENIDIKPSPSDSMISQSQADGLHTNQNSNQMKVASEPPSQVHSSNEDSNDSYDDEASDAEGTDNGHSSVTDLAQPKLEPPDYMLSDRSRTDSLMNPALFDPQRQRSGYNMPFNLQNLQDIAGLIPSLSGMHNNSQDSYGMMRRSSETGKVRATDPRPCPKCNKIYRSAHTLRTHLEDKHTICPGYRCVLCGTVAKSRNSLHSHMSRQHRGISTKDLPVLPMPSPFDPEMASRLYLKAGIKMSAAELRARASPTGTITPLRRSDTRTDLASSDNNSCSGDEDPQDLSINSNNKYNTHPTSSPLDFHHQSSKINNSISSLLINMLPLSTLSGFEKENVDS